MDIDFSQEHVRRQLEKQATQLLHRAGYTANGRRPDELLPKDERARLVPNGGFSGRSSRKPPRTVRVHFSG